MENTLLNLIPAAYLPEVHISQYDIGRTLTFNLKEGASDYNVPTGATVTVKATKPSGFGFAVPCTFSGGVVTLVVTETMTPEHGRFPAELSIVSGNTTIGTSNFIFNIERSPHPEGTIDGDAETIIPELTLLVERIEAAAEDVDEKAELFLNLSAEAETLPAGSLATANYSDGVLTLGIPRGYDGDDTKADAIVKSASGEVASFSDGGNGLLVKTLNVNIVPKQSGSGDPSPSNVRPISGTDTVGVTRAGKNLVNSTISSQTINGITVTVNNGVVTLNGTASSQVALIVGTARLMEGKGYIISGMPSTSASNKYFLNLIPSPSTGGSDANYYTPTTITPISDLTETIRIYVRSGQTVNNLVFEPMIRFAEDTDGTYQPFSGYNTYPVSLGQTVYGGTLEVTSGKLTIDRAFATIDGSNPSHWWTQNGVFLYDRLTNIERTDTISTANDIVISNQYKSEGVNYRGSQSDKTIIKVVANNSQFAIKDTSLSAVADLMTQLNNTPLQVAYKIATPTEIQLTPTQVNTLLGNNNIFADSGSVEVEYRADTTLAYNELLSLIASL